MKKVAGGSHFINKETFTKFREDIAHACEMTEDEVENAKQLNRCIEDALNDHPAQYMWMHKRFKTNPDLTRQTLYQAD